MNFQFESSWRNLIWDELQKQYFQEIKTFLETEIKSEKIIYPHLDNVFAAFNTTPLVNLKVVILGQDPYHWSWQAHGLSFSVQKWIKIPPSLRNIYKELNNEYPGYCADSWDLTHWAKQWVLMLNSILTVEAAKPASHAKIWWAQFTDWVLQELSKQQEWLIFVLWGAFAQTKKALINTDKHFILESAHPSPFSAHRWFLWNWHFKKINEILRQEWKEEIRW
jgi:uracil-DNA glycosylase